MLTVSSFSSPPSSHCLFTSISSSSSFLSFSQNPNLSRSISCLASSSSSSSSRYQNPQNRHEKPSKKRLVEKRQPLKKQSLSKRNNFDDTKNGFNGDNNDFDDDDESGSFHPSPLPQPPAGFVLDSHGKVLMASSKRLATIVDNTNNLPLECVIRRVFESSNGDQCMLLCPVDTPVQILKSSNFDGWSACDAAQPDDVLGRERPNELLSRVRPNGVKNSEIREEGDATPTANDLCVESRSELRPSEASRLCGEASYAGKGEPATYDKSLNFMS